MSSKAPSYSVNMPAAPTAPTATQTAQDYAAALPVYYQTALQYEPQMAALEKQINEQLYPTTAGLQETLAGQANTGMTQSAPDWYKANVEDTLKSQLGRNLVYNPQAQEQFGLATNQAYKDWGDYYRNLGLSVANRQTLASSPNLMSTYTPAANMGYASNMFGTTASMYNNQYSNQAQLAQARGNWTNPWANIAGQIGGSAIGSYTGLKIAGMK